MKRVAALLAAVAMVAGAWAVRVLDEGLQVDAVLMDVQMPEMDGLEATRRIRAQHPQLPVIGQTAHALRDEHARCLAAGMAATVNKPIEIEALVETILGQRDISNEAGIDLSLGVEYRPFLNNNIIVKGFGALFQPLEGFREIYSGQTLWQLGTEITLVY